MTIGHYEEYISDHKPVPVEAENEPSDLKQSLDDAEAPLAS